MRRESKAERAAWTKFVSMQDEPKPSKYGNERAGKYASKHEADVAMKLDALHRAGQINNLGEQVRFTLVEGRGRVRPVIYIADFVYFDLSGQRHVLDAKGFKTQMYRLKKRMMELIHDIDVEEV